MRRMLTLSSLALGMALAGNTGAAEGDLSTRSSLLDASGDAKKQLARAWQYADVQLVASRF